MTPSANRIVMSESLLRCFRQHRGLVTTGLFNCVFKPALVARELCIMIAGTVIYPASLLISDRTRPRNLAVMIRNSAPPPRKHSWWLLFKAWRERS